MVFDKQWFHKYQKILLFLVNNKLGKKIFCIDNDNKIIRIEPNSTTWQVGKNKYATDFRTHDKYAKRLYHAFKPLWFLFHAFDMGIANNLDERLNLGFDTLTAYPDANPETTTVDGRCLRDSVNESFATIRAGAGTTGQDSGTTITYSLQASTTSNQYQSLSRSFLLFDTSSLTESANISSAIFSYYVTAVSDYNSNGNSVNSKANLCASNPASNTAIVASDYQNISDTSFGVSVVQNSLTTSAYNDATLNASGISAISKTGISKFGLRYGWDLSNTLTGYTWASTGFQAVVFNSADQTGTANDPKLVVTYSLGSGTSSMFLAM